MANIRVKDLDSKASFASDDEILMDSPSGTGTMLRDAFIAAVASQIVAAPSTYKIATLDGANKLTSSQDPSQSVSYLGGHDMVANSPALADGSGTAGDTYYVTNPGQGITAAETSQHKRVMPLFTPDQFGSWLKALQTSLMEFQLLRPQEPLWKSIPKTRMHRQMH